MKIRPFLLGGAVGMASAFCLFATVRAAAPNGALSMPDLLYAAADICSGAPKSDESPFLTENTAAMDKMMAGMDVRPTGDVDADFAAMMIPHHQGAIDMAWPSYAMARTSNCVASRKRSSSISSRKSSRCVWPSDNRCPPRRRADAGSCRRRILRRHAQPAACRHNVSRQ